MKTRLIAGGVFLMAAGLSGACSSTKSVVGTDTSTGQLQGSFADAGWACACPNSEASCPLKCPDGTTGTCESGQPFCDIQVGDAGWACACPNGQTDCAITCPDGTAGRCTNGQPTCGAPPPDAGTNCCPVGWDLYSCTFPDGGAGQACHNPSMGCPSSTTCGEGCDRVVTGTCGGSGDAGTNLRWYTTCSYPVCQVGDGGVEPPGQGCPAVGSSCSQVGQTCGTASQQNCGVTLVCASQDPKGGVGGCPISTRAYKDGITYVDEERLRELHDEALALKLATYTYKPEAADPAPKHLGFIIEDNLASPAVDPAHSRVDMYGYVSLVVAGMQVQEREIADLRAQLAAARRDVAACKTKPAR